MVRDCLPDDIGISVSYPLPGTKFYERVKAELGEKQNWQDSDDLAMLYRGPFPAEFYRLLHRFIHAEYRLHKIVKRGHWRELPRAAYEAVRWVQMWAGLRPYLQRIA
jgi:anaerobic magnesium-protoporphyrin IX monomethyl ester cyclase